jgi:dihydrodipicolinate synthase/N-acetylneuraminate lyase
VTGQPGGGPRAWRGIFAIPPTPFDEQGDLDLAALRRVIDFTVECGVHGIVYPVMVSEFFVLSEAERAQLTPIVVRQAAGRCPIVIGVSATCTQAAVALAQVAQAAGADAVIAMPPYLQRYSDDDVRRHFAALDAIVEVPIFVQNAGPWNPVGQAVLLRLARELEHVHFIKEEVPPAHQHIGAIAAAAEPAIWGIFGGGGAANLFGELRRGAAGNMPGAQFADILSHIFDLYAAGQEAEAVALHRRVMPLIERAGPPKEILVKRGVIRCARTRALQNRPFDDQDRRDRDAWWPELAAEFTWTG